MKEIRQSIIPLPFDVDPKSIIRQIESEAKKFWDQGWVVVKTEPDGLLENLCIYFEREIHHFAKS